MAVKPSAAVILMPKSNRGSAVGRSRKRRQSARQLVFPDLDVITLLTLADNTILLQDNPITLAQDVFITHARVIAAIRSLTGGEVPVELGIAKGSLTIAEIGEKLVASPTSQDDVPAVEHAKRYARTIGTFGSPDTDQLLNNGEPIMMKVMLKVTSGQELPKFWAKNLSGGSLTTGAVIRLNTTYFGRWM